MEQQQNGVCRLSIVPVRAEGRESSELVTQLLFGDHYTVLEKSKEEDWLKVRIHFDSYEGWINHKQHHSISDAYLEELFTQDYQFCGEIAGQLQLQDEFINIVFGSIVPLAGNELFDMSKDVKFSGKTLPVRKIRDFAILKEIAFQYINSPYLWGGKTPFGIDCSGFVQMVFRLCGYSLKRDASQQVQQGKLVNSVAEALPGDLAFFQNPAGKIVHVGIILENQEIIHASGKVRVDGLDDNGIFIRKSRLYTHKLFSIKRFIV